ncbi:hypothetical protein [Nocardia sp. XZ_19_385]|uniref:hypothetical protein n=1 Tax=Nocardia sp. XZ_19_385 TaxID=2769488 RepID=UPI00188E52B7|nr:hypothetical protein [Nocardia sp. XZ_19_385]
MTVLRAVMEPGVTEVGGWRGIDVYDLPHADLTAVAGIYLAADIDQEFLADHREWLSRFVFDGGRVLVNGHVQRIFLDGLTRWRTLDFRKPADLALTRVSEHPVWAGMDARLFLYNTGTPGRLSFEELERIGVAGFYGRGYYLDLPDGAQIIHTIGPTACPIDYVYPLGAGQVLVHGGNDLLQFAAADRGASALAGQLLSWLGQR